MDRYVNLKVEDSIRIRCDRRRLFDYLTDAQKLGEWWPTSAESDPKMGGELVLHWQNGSQTATRFEEFIQDRRIAFPFGKEYVELTIGERDNECILTVCHSRITIRETSFNLLIHIAQSWTFLLLNLKSILEIGVDFRSAQV